MKSRLPSLTQLSGHIDPKFRDFVGDVKKAENHGLVSTQMISVSEKRIIGRILMTKEENGYELVELSNYLESTYPLKTKYLKFPDVVGCCGIQYNFKLMKL